LVFKIQTNPLFILVYAVCTFFTAPLAFYYQGTLPLEPHELLKKAQAKLLLFLFYAANAITIFSSTETTTLTVSASRPIPFESAVLIATRLPSVVITDVM